MHSLNNNLKLINKHFASMKLKHTILYHHSYGLKTKISNFLMKNIYKKIIWLEHWHHPAPYLKSTLTEVYQTFGEEMMACSANRFRADNDLTQYLYRYWRLAKEDFYPYKYGDGYDYLNRALEYIDRDESIRFVCFNDQMMQANDEKFERSKELLVGYLESKFPKKAIFEKEIK